MENEDIGTDFDLPTIIRGLHQDLLDLRAGKITALEAKARADLAKQMFNGMRMLVQAQQFLSRKAQQVNAIEDRT